MDTSPTPLNASEPGILPELSAQEMGPFSWITKVYDRLGLRAASSGSGVMSVNTRQPIPSSSTPAFDGLLVSWAPGTPASERAAALQALGLSLRQEIHTAAMQSAGAGVLDVVILQAG